MHQRLIRGREKEQTSRKKRKPFQVMLRLCCSSISFSSPTVSDLRKNSPLVVFHSLVTAFHFQFPGKRRSRPLYHVLKVLRRIIGDPGSQFERTTRTCVAWSDWERREGATHTGNRVESCRVSHRTPCE